MIQSGDWDNCNPRRGQYASTHVLYDGEWPLRLWDTFDAILDADSKVIDNDLDPCLVVERKTLHATVDSEEFSWDKGEGQKEAVAHPKEQMGLNEKSISRETYVLMEKMVSLMSSAASSRGDMEEKAAIHFACAAKNAARAEGLFELTQRWTEKVCNEKI